VAADLKFLGDLDLGVFAGAQQGAGFFQIIILQSFGPAPDTAAPPRGLGPGIDALTQDPEAVLQKQRLLNRLHGPDNGQ
jgi:hypothetical protein